MFAIIRAQARSRTRPFLHACASGAFWLAFDCSS